MSWPSITDPNLKWWVRIHLYTDDHLSALNEPSKRAENDVTDRFLDTNLEAAA